MQTKLKPIPLAATPLDETDCHAKVSIAWETGMNVDFSDISFVDSDYATQLPQFLEKKTDGVTSTWWIKVVNKPAAGKTVYALFCDASATLRSSPEDVFAFYDTGESGDMSKWTVSKAGPDAYAIKSNGFIELKTSQTNPYHVMIRTVDTFPGSIGLRFKLKSVGRTGQYEPVYTGIMLIEPNGNMNYPYLYYLDIDFTYDVVLGLDAINKTTGALEGNRAPQLFDGQTYIFDMYKRVNVKGGMTLDDGSTYAVVLDNKPQGAFDAANPVTFRINQALGTSPYNYLYIGYVFLYNVPSSGSLDAPVPGNTLDRTVSADFTANPRKGRAPLAVAFTDLSTGSPTGWLWDFGDGQTSTEQNPMHTYQEPGYYAVKLTAVKYGYENSITKTSYIDSGGTMVDTLIDDIAFRIQNPLKERWQFAPHILRTLNRLYKRLNHDCGCLIKPLAIDFSTTEDHWWTLPSDFIQLVRIYPQRTFKDPREFVFDGEIEANTGGFITILENRLHFNNIGHTETFTVWYLSSGLVLVDKADADLLPGEINDPEWPELSLHQILYYGACVELKEKYPNREHDLSQYQFLSERLKRSGISRQTVTPQVIGGYGERTGREGSRDDFGYSDARN